jgi:2-polyprenyl-3-methyl-5-hydroxy-6-metoxy-1,4-benzoquinol methylase
MRIINKMPTSEKRPAGVGRSDDYYKLSREEMVKYIPCDARTILDVGCGQGAFSRELKNKLSNVEAWGIEIESEVAEKAKENLDKILVVNVEDEGLELPAEYFDCIVCNDVLEHMKDPWGVLKRLRRSLKNDGLVISSIPNVRYYKNLKALLRNKEWKYESSGILDIGHLRFFTQKSIITMFEECGYSVIKIEGINPMNWSWKLKFVNAILFDVLNDMKYLQFACVAKIK